MVSELISPVTGQWDKQLISDTFSADEARLILNLPLRDESLVFLACHFDPRGLHSVRNAYKLYMQGEAQAAGTDVALYVCHLCKGLTAVLKEAERDALCDKGILSN
jgi:hypothetical protein